MSERFDTAGPWRRYLRRFAASGPGAWLFARILQRLDEPVHRLTRGRHMLSSLLAGLPVIMLTTTGARSGRSRTVPLLGLPVEGGMAVIASNWGQRHAPGWSHNLRADPHATMSVLGRERPVRAVVAEGERRAAIWQRGLQVYPGYAQYERRASHRRIVVWVLEPSDAAPPAG